MTLATLLRQKNLQAVLTLKPPWLLQVRFVSVPRIRAKPDRELDEVTDRDKILRPFFRIMDVMSGQKGLAVKLRYLERIGWQFGIKNKTLTLTGFLKRYPNIFHVYKNPEDGRMWCKCTPEFAALIDEDRQLFRDMEPQSVQTLRRLLMMAAVGRICVDKLQDVRRIFGFPKDLVDRFIPEYPRFFKLAHFGLHTYVELVEWDDDLAVSEFEKRAKRDAMNKGMGDIEVRGKPLPFKIRLSPGMALRKKNLEVLESWQKLPYISPYEDWTLVTKGTPISEKRLAALMHEFLSLTIEKKARLKVIQPFREEFGLSQKVYHLFERFPGIFYTSQRGAVKTIMLREAYKGSELHEDHPLLHFKKKFVEMVNAGPRLRGSKVEGEHIEGQANETEDAGLCESSSDGEGMSDTDAAEETENECRDMDDCNDDSNEGDVETFSCKTSA
ncbi:hypothetical protein GOP47_0009065 [Adiantum capillus-veneris]|uniref:PORR domain-containing protein n=1 Tax=Adiantum capillus-veneris TaxID=13818 RepID=A0A9D4V055_ADICA|nr:hypothetical protein GOP47_0009065 [Adiantum capillus-veneris]